MLKLLTLLFLISSVSYIDRINIAVAGKGLMEEYGIDPVRMGVLFSSFVLGYALFQLPGGAFADRFGGKLTLFVALIWWSVFTALTGVAGDIALSLGFSVLPFLVLVRFLVGAGEAAAFPSYNRIVASELPEDKKGLGMGISIGGIGVGAALTPPFVVLVMESLGWRWAFYLSALLGILLAFLWWVSVSEKGSKKIEERGNFLQVLKRKEVWFLTLSYSTFGYIVYVYYSWFFLYLNEVRGINLKESALLSMLPFVSLTAGSFIGGYMSDRLRERFGLNVGRVLVVVSGMSLAGFFILLGGASEGNLTAVFNLSAGAFFLFLSLGAYWALPIEFSNPNAGKISGIMNTGANLGGTISPTLTPLIAQSFGWQNAINFSALMAFLGALLILGCWKR
ncbi:ACS family glucarate transporter-like MFS transporter [Hydrogenivirga caldilitoris]|uniref:ACS family glucarate transporter-like MFS transporter n=1 Tax=Hydrogenivirga caldilitoris TaxID=246264 RepID=A0A497XR82_9AQUI|nr:MFS transporter [Hydrogenivirga caldilitoris]RLJ70774.1 ACS family glucarate transporter-like MFS transporter [Hydrogenivirga caldilitoris]